MPRTRYPPASGSDAHPAPPAEARAGRGGAGWVPATRGRMSSGLVLGLSCFYHDAAACLVRDGRIVAAAQEERFSRVKHDARFPTEAVAYCLAEGGAAVADLDAVAFYDKPLLTFERLLETYLSYAPRGLPSFLAAMPVWLRHKLWTPSVLAEALGYGGPVLFTEHHEAHAASAFFPSPHERAAVLTVDGVGEWATTTVGVGEGAGLQLLEEVHFPHSLGLLYSAFTTFCGFRVNSGEYKLMGLAPYGEPRYAATIREHLVDLRADGSFRLNADYFTYAQGLRMTGRRFARLFGGPPRRPEGPLTQREMDLAASVQTVVEDAVLGLARRAHDRTGADALCLAGGVALNCVANGRVVREGPFRDVWVQPAAGDAGGAVGAALAVAHGRLGAPRRVARPDGMSGALLGPGFTDAEAEAALVAAGLPARRAGDLEDEVAALLADGLTVGWCQGRMEFGPRSLGARSILADPRDAGAQRRVNLQVKFREGFRPFAPAVLAERAAEWFALDGESPYMLVVAPVRGAEPAGGAEGLAKLDAVRSPLPAVTHVDGSARIQTVDGRATPPFRRLLEAFERRTGCPVVLNTSLNVRGEPVARTPADAVRCFLDTHLDALAVGPFVVVKDEVPGARDRALSAEAVADAYGLD